MQKIDQPKIFTTIRCWSFESTSKKLKQITHERPHKGVDVSTNDDNYS